MKESPIPLTPSIILFDGVCNLCNGFVQFILARESAPHLKFAALQSTIGVQLLQYYQLPLEQTPSSIIFIEKGVYYTQSAAILKIASHLKGGWQYATYLLYLPKPFRDFIYNRIAKNRYLLFGKTTACWLPTPALKSRFLE